MAKTKRAASGAAAKKESTAVATKQANPLAAFDFGEDAGKGFENVTVADLTIPFLNILQALSPQIEDEAYPDAKTGMIFNTVKGTLIDGKVGVIFQPCFYEKLYAEFTPRDAGGGFHGTHQPNSDLVKEAIARNDGDTYGDLKTPEGNDLIETHYYYGNVFDPADMTFLGRAVIGMKSTQIKVAKGLNTITNEYAGKVPLWAWAIKLTTVKQTHDQGTSYNWHVSAPDGNNFLTTLITPQSNPEWYDAGKAFHEAMADGKLRDKVDFGNQQSGKGDAPDDEVPF